MALRTAGGIDADGSLHLSLPSSLETEKRRPISGMPLFADEVGENVGEADGDETLEPLLPLLLLLALLATLAGWFFMLSF